MNLLNKPVFTTQSLENYTIIREPGTYIVKCAYDVKNLYNEDSNPRYLVPFRVIPHYNLPELTKIMRNKSEVPFDSVRNLFLKGALWPSQVESELQLPTKGEALIATFEYGTDDVFLCKSISLIPRKDLEKFDFSLLVNPLTKKLFGL